MEDLQSLMTCLDDISSKIPDGIYLDMTDKLKRVHAQMNGNKPFHEDTFYYSDDDSELDSNSDDDSEYEPLTEDELRLGREREVQKIKDEILECVKEMREEYKVLKRWEKESRRTWTPIKRMTATRKSEAIQEWCEKNTRWTSGGKAGELVGHISTTAIVLGGWTWKNLVENGLRTIVVEIATEEEKVALANRFGWAPVTHDDLSLETIKKLPAFEKKIYDDYKERYQMKMNQHFDNVRSKVSEQRTKMSALETACVEREYLLGGGRGSRPFWNSATNEFCANGGHP